MQVFNSVILHVDDCIGKKASSDAEENRVEIQGKTNLGYEKDVDDEEMVEVRKDNNNNNNNNRVCCRVCNCVCTLYMKEAATMF